MENDVATNQLVDELRSIIEKRDELILTQQEQLTWHHKYNARVDFWKNVLGGLAIFIVIAGVIGALAYGVIRSNDQDARTAQQCIAAGNIWTHNDCVPAKR